jgi:hypothetical protein
MLGFGFGFGRTPARFPVAARAALGPELSRKLN